jgi:hypothetical protein
MNEVCYFHLIFFIYLFEIPLVPANEVHETNDGKTIRIEYREENGTIFKVYSFSFEKKQIFRFINLLDNKNISKSKIESITNCC